MVGFFFPSYEDVTLEAHSEDVAGYILQPKIFLKKSYFRLLSPPPLDYLMPSSPPPPYPAGEIQPNDTSHQLPSRPSLAGTGKRNAEPTNGDMRPDFRTCRAARREHGVSPRLD